MSGIPFVRVRSRGRVGADVFERLGLAPSQVAPSGLVDDLAWFRTAAFDPDRVDPQVRAFYEGAGRYHLDTVVRPATWFRPALVLFSLVASRIGQTDFPYRVPLGESSLTNRIGPLRIDGHPAARSWVRTWQVAQRAPRVLYAAAYSRHANGPQRYLDIAFPFPHGTLTSILRFVDSDRGGTELTTDHPGGETRRHAGIWWVGRRRALRLPMSERIRVWPGDAPGLPEPIAGRSADVVAEHHIRFLGLVILTLHYVARAEPASDSTTRTS
jgi:hypothetical protein